VQYVDMALLQKGSACLALQLANGTSDEGGSIRLLPVESLAFSHVPAPVSRLQEVTNDLSQGPLMEHTWKCGFSETGHVFWCRALLLRALAVFDHCVYMLCFRLL